MAAIFSYYLPNYTSFALLIFLDVQWQGLSCAYFKPFIGQSRLMLLIVTLAVWNYCLWSIGFNYISLYFWKWIQVFHKQARGLAYKVSGYFRQEGGSGGPIHVAALSVSTQLLADPETWTLAQMPATEYNPKSLPSNSDPFTMCLHLNILRDLVV